ncbi:MAG: RNA-binding protein [Methanobacteriaceae archaeon]|jgi:predicted SPOUT superfamily RNA methylase MTH1|nr:RNA-binding protein [Candidatus Methanorudis spinitermitis]
MHKKQVSIFIPDSYLAETSDLKLKTSKVGLIGRTLAVFRVDQVVIYKDLSDDNGKGRNDADFIGNILSYMNTPQYLRKKAFPIMHDLKHVGILPPLRTPYHPTDVNPKVGDFRQGFTIKRNKKGTFVDIGMESLVFCKEQLSVNKIYSFKITKLAKEVIVTPDEPDDVYWGYKTLSTHKSLKNSLKLVNPDLVISTTRYANTINSIFNELKSKIEKSKNIAILFGSPYSGLNNEELDTFSSWELVKVNTIPYQGTETIRTEEAVISSLSIFNLLWL